MGRGKTIILIDGDAPPPLIPSTRFTLALLVLFALIVQYSQRVNLPIAIVCMTNRTRIHEHRLPPNDTMITNRISADKSVIYSSTTHKSLAHPSRKSGFFTEKQFNWVELQQQILLGGYWAGYIFTQIPGKFFALC